MTQKVAGDRKNAAKGLALVAAVLVIMLLLVAFMPNMDQRTYYVPTDKPNPPFENYNTSMEMKDPMVRLIRDVCASYYLGSNLSYPEELDVEADWQVMVTHYYKGEIVGESTGTGFLLSLALEMAVRGSMSADLKYYDLNISRFKVQLLEPIRYSFIEYRGEALELVSDVVPVRELTKEMMRENIEMNKQYLLRVIDQEVSGAHKYYYALDDTYENRVHCIYTASLMFSLMRIYDYDHDESLWGYLDKCSDFLLSMQYKDKKKAYGAFHYSYFLDTDEKEMRFVVGTTSKTIFTLLMLYERTGEKKYLDAAELAGDWLLTMQEEDGSMKSYIRYASGSWFSSTQFSCLFNGQVLSALSRLYRVDGEQKYLDAAERIAEYFVDKIDAEGWYLGDDYRSPNPISTSWSILGLFDFFLASGDQFYLDLVLNNSGKLLKKQFTDDGNVLSFGRWDASQTTSGNGWLNEVFSELYHYRKENNLGGLEEIRTALARVTRYGIQNTYTYANSYMCKNPSMAVGGAYWNSDYRYVRTDSVCHAVNAYAAMVNEYDDGVLVSVPSDQEPLYDVLERMREDAAR